MFIKVTRKELKIIIDALKKEHSERPNDDELSILLSSLIDEYRRS